MEHCSNEIKSQKFYISNEDTLTSLRIIQQQMIIFELLSL